MLLLFFLFQFSFFLLGSSFPNRLNVAWESWWVAQAFGNLQLLPRFDLVADKVSAMASHGWSTMIPGICIYSYIYYTAEPTTN